MTITIKNNKVINYQKCTSKTLEEHLFGDKLYCHKKSPSLCPLIMNLNLKLRLFIYFAF